MSRLVSHILLSMLMLPIAMLVYGGSATIIEVNLRGTAVSQRETILFLVSGLVTWGFVACYWFALWGRRVEWTPGRVGRTGAATIIAFMAGAAVGAIGAALEPSFGVFLGSVTAPLLWLVGTVLAWRETPAERKARAAASSAIVCPNCGYNLTGLTATRCPECGTQYTLNELLGQQPNRAAAEVEG